MHTSALDHRPNPRGSGFPLDLIAIGAISLTVVGLLAFGYETRIPGVHLEMPQSRGAMIVLGAIVVGMFGTALVHLITALRRDARNARAEASQLAQRLAGVESMIRAEPQVLIYWEPGLPLSVVTHALTGVAGLPTDHRVLLRFGQWLDGESAIRLKAGLDQLFGQGHAFSLTLKTHAGGHLEAEGRTAGRRAMLRFRDLVGYKQDLARILDQHHALRRDINLAHAALDSLPSPVWLRDEHGRLTWVNTAYASAVDASRPDVAARQIELLERQQRAAVDKAVARGTGYRERLHLVMGGERKHHDLVVAPAPGGQAALALDVTAAEQAQGALDRQSAAYERTLDKVATAVAIFDTERKLTYFNAAFQRLWQLDAGWLKSAPAEGTLLDRLREAGLMPEDRNYRDWKAKFLARTREAETNEELWHLPDGRTLQVIVENRGDGGANYLFADQTERFALESRFNEQIKTQRETLDSLKEGVAVFGTDGRLKFLNEAFTSIWHLTEAYAADKPHIRDVIARISTAHDDPAAWSALLLACTKFSDERHPIDGTLSRADQTIAYAATPLPDGATLLAFRDVTVAKRYERALEERNQALEAADRMKSQFIGHVSYELRTPLTNIIGFNELLSSPLIGQLNPKQREYLSDITASSKTLLSIIDDILDLATIDAGALELKLERVDVAGVVDQAIDGIRDRAMKAKLTIDIGRAEDAVSFVADEARVRQVLYNLLSNAVGFSKPGDTVEITAWREQGFMKFSVADQGVGVPAEHIGRVFDRFESRSHGSKHRGAGLGLSLVKSLVDLHGGAVAFESEPGRCTKVTVSFPEHRVEARESPVASADAAASTPALAPPAAYIPAGAPSAAAEAEAASDPAVYIPPLKDQRSS